MELGVMVLYLQLTELHIIGLAVVEEIVTKIGVEMEALEAAAVLVRKVLEPQVQLELMVLMLGLRVLVK